MFHIEVNVSYFVHARYDELKYKNLSKSMLATGFIFLEHNFFY